MHLRTLYLRSLTHHARAHLAVMLGVITGTAALTGALLVGDALRGSLRAAALDRLGRVAYAVRSPHFFREVLAEEIAARLEDHRAPSSVGPPSPTLPSSVGPPSLTFEISPAILDRGSVTHADTRATVHAVNVLGVDARFWQLGTGGHDPLSPEAGRVVVLNQPLAEELRARPGDDLLLRLGKPAAISPETLLGRRSDTTLTLRLTVHDVIPAEGLGAFTLNPRQAVPRNAYVPLATLQRALGRRERVNTLLVAAHPDAAAGAREGKAALQALIQQRVTLGDLGLRLHSSQEHDYVALESEAFLLAPPVETAGRDAAESIGCPASAVLSYLANSIAVKGRPATSIPYSVVAALDPAPALMQSMTLTEGGAAATPGPGEILLNEWSARQLNAEPGDEIRLSYYVPGLLGRLDTRQATFRLRGVVRLTGPAADPGFTPAYPGVTDTDNLADWDPPFPIDLRQIRDQDEAYWDRHRATPKAFVSLADGQRLWADRPERFGRLTALRVHVPPGDSLATTRAAFESRLLRFLDVTRVGVTFDAVRARALAASRGTTDFAGLFIGFSFFLIVSAALLVALLFRLNVERRASEIGLLMATGFPPRRVTCLLLVEGTLIAVVGAGVGLLAARGYAWLMLAGLRTWWAAAVSAPFLQLHDTATSYVVGLVGGVLVAVVSIVWSLRGVTRAPPRALLAGVVQAGRPTTDYNVAAPQASSRWLRQAKAGATPRLIALLAAGLGAAVTVLSLLTDLVPQTTGFFVGGTALLIAGLAGFTAWLKAEKPRPLAAYCRGYQLVALLRLGLRNARRQADRSLLTAGLIASATFVITALESVRLTTPGNVRTRDSATGGFTLLAECTVPLPFDLNTPEGRAALNLSDAAQQTLAGVSLVPFRLRDGDETSCLNLYVPTRPRLLGATEAMIERGGFALAASLAESEPQRRNPWRLLRTKLPDGAVPVIADEAAARWQMHLDLGDDFTIADERGREVRLRLVALLRGSFLQGELIIAETDFTRLFPSIAGYAFHLIDAPTARTPSSSVGPPSPTLEQTLERELAEFGCAVTPTTQRLADLFAVQNTYLSTFQTLGGLGLLLGTVGLAATVVRSVWERRAELALLRTLGFSHVALGGLVLIENAFLIAIGLLIGLFSAAMVVAPHVVSRGMPIPWLSLLLMFGAIFAAGLIAGALALIPTLRAPLLPALRSE